MSIQISVTIWTVLCFVALMLVLDRLLFRPLLTFMDQRQRKIDDARAAKENALRQREEELRLRQEERLSEEKQVLRESSEALDRIERDYDRRIAEKKADNERRLAELRTALAGESRQILGELESQTDSLADAFIERIQTWRDSENAVSEEEETAAPHVDDGPARLSFMES